MTDTDLHGVSDHTPEARTGDDVATDRPRRRRAQGLDGMVLAELQQLAGSLGISGTGRMRKGQLVDAIRAAQGGGAPAPAQAPASVPDGTSAVESAPVDVGAKADRGPVDEPRPSAGARVDQDVQAAPTRVEQPDPPELFE